MQSGWFVDYALFCVKVMVAKPEEKTAQMGG
jgi:hypothetical protein